MSSAQEQQPGGRRATGSRKAVRATTARGTAAQTPGARKVTAKASAKKVTAKTAGAKRGTANTAGAKKAAARRATSRVSPQVRRSDPRPAADRLPVTPEGQPTPRPRLVSVPPPAEETVRQQTIEDVVVGGVEAARATLAGAGVGPEDAERIIATGLAFLRRRIAGDYEVDDFGFDEDFTRSVYLPALRPLYRQWFRVEVRGIENIPDEGGGLVVANHSGTIAIDALMTRLAVHDEHPRHRHLRMLGADLVFQTPFMADLARKTGATLATNPDAERLLRAGELVGVWPEGFKGVGKPFSERYKLQRFGRGGFVSAALRTGVPIIPCSIVGAEEAYPMLGNLKTVARLLGLPYAPVTPTWPLLGPLGLVPLPSKWIIEFGAPLETAELGEAAADDPMLVFDLTDQVRETIQQTLYTLLMRRRSVFS